MGEAIGVRNLDATRPRKKDAGAVLMASSVKNWVALSSLKARRADAKHMGEASGARNLDATRALYM